MIDVVDFKKMKTGLELEKEFNRIITLALNYELSHVIAEEILTDIYDYGVSSGKFSKSEHKYYLQRKNCYGKSSIERTHINMAINIKKGQDREHEVFLYFLKWLRNEYPNNKMSWDYYGSDSDGFIMIVNKQLKEVVKPDYKVRAGKRILYIETKSFFTSPTFKIENITKYRSYGDDCFLCFRYKSNYYLVGFNGMEKILKLDKKNHWKQDVVIMSDENLNIFLKNKWLKDIKI